MNNALNMVVEDGDAIRGLFLTLKLISSGGGLRYMSAILLQPADIRSIQSSQPSHVDQTFFHETQMV